MSVKSLLNNKSSGETLEKVKLKTKSIGRALNRIILLFIFVILPMAAAIVADDSGLIQVPIIVKSFLSTFVIILLSYILASIFLKLTVNLVSNSFEYPGGPEEKILLSKIYVGFIFSLATVVVFWQLGTDIENIFLSIGLVATGFAFAIRDVILSYFIWFILLTKKPFKIGDYIRVGDDDSLEGLVKHIGLFYVVVDPTPETYEDYFKIPNKMFLEKPIKNYGRGKFRNEFEMYFEIEELQANFPAKVEALKEKVWGSLDVDVSFFLGADSDGVKVTVQYKSTFEHREQVRHQITSIMLNDLKLLDDQYLFPTRFNNNL